MVFKIIDDELFDRLHDDDAVSLCCLGILQLVLLGVEGKRRIPDWLLRLANDRVGWDNYPWGSYVWPTLYSQLKNPNVRRWPKLYATRPTSEIDKKTYLIFGYTWAFKTWILESFRVTATRYYNRYNRYPRVAAWKKKGKFMGSMVDGNLSAERLTPDETEARSDWWISSRAYFDGRIGQAERVPRHVNSKNMYEIPSELVVLHHFRHIQTTAPSLISVRQRIGKHHDRRNMVHQIGKRRCRLNLVYQIGKARCRRSRPLLIGNPLSLRILNILNRGKREQRPSFYKRIPYTEKPPTTVLPKQRGNKNKNNVKKANLSPLNLGSAFNDENEGGDDVIFLGGRFTSNYLVYENVDPEKVKRENYVNYTDFLNHPEQIYLYCYMKGYSVLVTFWQQLVPHLYRPNIDSRTPMGWLSAEHMNSWMELLIRLRRSDDPWTVAYTNTISVHPENQRFMLETDQHSIGTLDGSTRPYPAWSVVDWVFMPIHVEGNHWVTGVINLPNSHVYVFDSLPNEGRRMLLFNQIQRWTPLLNGILHGRGCFTQTRGPYNFQFSYNDGLGIQVPLQTNFSDCGVITCWLIFCLCTQRSPILNGDPQEFWETVRNSMCQCFYLSRCEDTRDCGYD
ncbi:phospholipase-like protein [Tanacetum coccineum]|uniref:Phospholipase-like protein n=1 Tax=Tanacetum coccineum TaxID=301880 RepID=A0ABQ5FP11_9ASTR